MRSDHTTGSKIVGFVSKQLLDSLTPQTLPPDRSYSRVIDTILSTGGAYSSKNPKIYRSRTNPWEYPGCLGSNFPDEWPRWFTRKNLWTAKNLESSPWTSFGYSEYTFTILLAGWLAYHRKEVSLGELSPFLRKGVSITSQTQSLKDWANNDILQSPAFLLVTGLLRESQTHSAQEAWTTALPPSRWTTIGHSSTWRRLQYFESNEPDPVEVGEVTKKRAGGCWHWADWCLVQACWGGIAWCATPRSTVPHPQLLQRPPAIDLRPDVISVKPSDQQRDRSSQALHVVGEQIEQRVIAKSEGSESLLTEEACSAYKAEIEQIVYQINQVPTLPPHLIDMLQNSYG